MPFSSPHVLVRALGVFGVSAGAPSEIWSIGMRINTGATGMGEAQKQAFLETAAGPFQTFHANTFVRAGSQTFLTALTAAYIGTDGKYVGGGSQSTTVRPYPSAIQGVGTNQVSWDVARVFTLRTAQSRGRGHVGRFYYPCQEVIQSDGRWDQASATGCATAAKALIENVNAAAKAQWTASFGISVMSEVGEVSYQVNSVDVGRAPDTQRRRTKALEETPSSAAISGVLTTAEVLATRHYEV